MCIYSPLSLCAVRVRWFRIRVILTPLQNPIELYNLFEHFSFCFPTGINLMACISWLIGISKVSYTKATNFNLWEKMFFFKFFVFPYLKWIIYRNTFITNLNRHRLTKDKTDIDDDTVIMVDNIVATLVALYSICIMDCRTRWTLWR